MIKIPKSVFIVSFLTIVLSIVVSLGIFTFLQKDNSLSGIVRYMYSDDTASSTVMTITSDTRILATSTDRIYARVINDCSSVVYLTDNADTPASLSSGFRLSASGGTWDSDSDNFIYTGSVRASSTDEDSCSLHVTEYR